MAMLVGGTLMSLKDSVWICRLQERGGLSPQSGAKAGIEVGERIRREKTDKMSDTKITQGAEQTAESDITGLIGMARIDTGIVLDPDIMRDEREFCQAGSHSSRK